MCKVPLNPSSDPSKNQSMSVSTNASCRIRLLILLIGHDVETARILRVAKGSQGWNNHSQDQRVAAVLVPIFRFTLFLEIKKNIQKQHIRPSPNNKTLILSGTANCVLYIGFLPMNINIKCAPSHLEHDMHTLQRSLEMFQIAPVGQRCGFGNTRSDTNTQSVNVGMPLDYRWYFNIWPFLYRFLIFFDLEC